jgi:hypothetical protein
MDNIMYIMTDPIYTALITSRDRLKDNFIRTEKAYAKLYGAGSAIYNDLMQRLQDEHDHIENGIQVRIDRRVMQLNEKH